MKMKQTLIWICLLMPIYSTAQNGLTTLLSKIKIEVENKCKHTYIQYTRSMESVMYEKVAQVNFNFDGSNVNYSYQYAFSKRENPNRLYGFRYDFDLSDCNYVLLIDGVDGKVYLAQSDPFYTVEISVSNIQNAQTEQQYSSIVRFQFPDKETATKVASYFEQAIDLAK